MALLPLPAMVLLQVDTLNIEPQKLAEKAAEVFSQLVQLPSSGIKVIVATGSYGGDADTDPVSTCEGRVPAGARGSCVEAMQHIAEAVVLWV